MTAAPDVIVLAGGRAERLGGTSKPDVRIGGRTLLERVLAAAAAGAAGARPGAAVEDGTGASRDRSGEPPIRAVVVGPPALAATPVPPGLEVRVTSEDPPFGGPVAGLAAGLAALEDRTTRATLEHTGSAPEAPILVLACDLPFASTAVGPLLARYAALHLDEDGTCAEHAGRLQWLAGVYRRDSLRRALAELETVRDASVRALMAPLRLVAVPGLDARDVDTWGDVAYARDEAGEPRTEDGPWSAADVAESAQRMGEEDR
ncbi:molybdenum cofactor guanylyltransferase [Occultella kanbiaonis]|uniref:molybdenum cofactor guanylyltransferase n=1 Tax=Occultella kanbiaonis TaxID=2675754 RepID=UPI001F23F794|nr:NTP transferase domain-containing protein [Occultella kanbiaonis]